MENTIITDRLILRALDGECAKQLLTFVSDGREYFEKYESKKDHNYYTEKQQEHILSSEYSLMREGKYARYYVILKDEPFKIIGTVSFGFFRPFPFSSCNIGYKFLREYQGFGYAREAAGAAIKEVFRSMNFHQIYAYIMPENTPSIKMAEALGFQKEGVSKQCLCVRDVWEDHAVYKLINPTHL